MRLGEGNRGRERGRERKNWSRIKRNKNRHRRIDGSLYGIAINASKYFHSTNDNMLDKSARCTCTANSFLFVYAWIRIWLSKYIYRNRYPMSGLNSDANIKSFAKSCASSGFSRSWCNGTRNANISRRWRAFRTYIYSQQPHSIQSWNSATEDSKLPRECVSCTTCALNIIRRALV